MSRLIDDLDPPRKSREVLPWACPVPFFGDILNAELATVGINPSNREFVDRSGAELGEGERRLETLDSLSLTSWSGASGQDVSDIARACVGYFQKNPYRLWFDVLDRMLSRAGASYYSNGGKKQACHLDLFPFATTEKWGLIPPASRRTLIVRQRATMAELIRDSNVSLLVLNGRAVVEEFESFSDNQLTFAVQDGWALPRRGGAGVSGVEYHGKLTAIAGVDLDREIEVFGYNHNLQSSFGVTSEVVARIGDRIGEMFGQEAAGQARRRSRGRATAPGVC